MEDADSQADLNLIQGQWVFSDECPVTTAQWSATELGSGRVVHNFTDMPSNIQAFYDDTVSLENLKMYVSHVRITDALGRTFEAYSDGVMVSIGTPDTAPVWEGAGAHDMDFQESLDIIEASWGAFGNSRSALPSDHVTRYVLFSFPVLSSHLGFLCFCLNFSLSFSLSLCLTPSDCLTLLVSCLPSLPNISVSFF